MSLIKRSEYLRKAENVVLNLYFLKRITIMTTQELASKIPESKGQKRTLVTYLALAGLLCSLLPIAPKFGEAFFLAAGILSPVAAGHPIIKKLADKAASKI